jgi:hypothetical protein
MAKRRRWKYTPPLDIHAPHSEHISARDHEDLVLQFLDRHRSPPAPPPRAFPQPTPAAAPKQKKTKRRNELQVVYYTWPKQGPVGPREVAYHVSTERPSWWGSKNPAMAPSDT